MRKKLGKLIGIEEKYTGVLGEISNDGHNVVIRDVKHKGKSICDHVWVSNTKNFKEELKGENVTFIAIAITYTDSRGFRKNGLSKCHSICKEHDSYNVLTHDFKHHARRVK